MKDIVVTFLFASLLVCTFVAQGPAQIMAPTASLETAAPQTPASGKNPASTAATDILPGKLQNTVAAANAMPEDKFSYKPTADQMTFGELVAHMAEMNNLLCGMPAGVPSPKVDEVKGTDSKDKLIAALKASFDFCSEALSKMDDSKLAEITVGPGGRQGTRAWWILFVVGHWFDHYATASTYLRLNGITPPSAQQKK
jgi:uncharacterized damage-inducible protein DinB